VSPPAPLVLAYHGVAPVPLRQDRFKLFVAPAQLRRDLRWLRRRGYRVTTFGELAERCRQGEGDGLAAVTFDDGLADNACLPDLLAAEGARATVFVVSDWIGGSHPDAPWARVLDERGIRALARGGLEIGSHGKTHTDLTVLGPLDVRAELAESKSTLEAIVGEAVVSAAYPFGRADAMVTRACRDAGYDAACVLYGKRFDDPFALSRQPVSNGSSITGLWVKRADRHQALTSIPGMRRIVRGSRALHSAHHGRRWRTTSAARGASAPR
jgi:peptidoglycan/xylan/chitin deacetylase (PgdA/CDA1 family)